MEPGSTGPRASISARIAARRSSLVPFTSTACPIVGLDVYTIQDHASRAPSPEALVLLGLERFCANQGLGSPALADPVIAAYLCTGLEGRAPSTKGTYHSVLRSVGGIETPKGAPRFSGSSAPAPYSAAERAELFAIVRAQRRGWRVRSALALLALCLGAGLRSGELVALKGSDVDKRGGRVLVHVGPPASRVVEMRPSEARLIGQLGVDADAYFFRPGE